MFWIDIHYTMYTVSFYKLVFLDPETKKRKDWIYSFLKLTVKYPVRRWHTMERPAINDKEMSSLPSWKFTICSADFGFIQHTHFKFVSMHGIRDLNSSQQLNLTILLIFVDMAYIIIYFHPSILLHPTIWRSYTRRKNCRPFVSQFFVMQNFAVEEIPVYDALYRRVSWCYWHQAPVPTCAQKNQLRFTYIYKQTILCIFLWTLHNLPILNRHLMEKVLHNLNVNFDTKTKFCIKILTKMRWRSTLAHIMPKHCYWRKECSRRCCLKKQKKSCLNLHFDYDFSGTFSGAFLLKIMTLFELKHKMWHKRVFFTIIATMKRPPNKPYLNANGVHNWRKAADAGRAETIIRVFHRYVLCSPFIRVPGHIIIATEDDLLGIQVSSITFLTSFHVEIIFGQAFISNREFLLRPVIIL